MDHNTLNSHQEDDLSERTNTLISRLEKKHTSPPLKEEAKISFEEYKVLVARIIQQPMPFDEEHSQAKSRRDKSKYIEHYMIDTTTTKIRRESPQDAVQTPVSPTQILRSLSMSSQMSPISSSRRPTLVAKSPVKIDPLPEKEDEIELENASCELIHAGLLYYVLATEEIFVESLDNPSAVTRNQKKHKKDLHYFRATGFFISKTPQFRYNIKLSKAIKKLWNTLKKDRSGHVLYDEYRAFSQRLLRCLVGEVMTGEEVSFGNDDWVHDCEGGVFMCDKTFHDVIFEVADIWLNSKKLGEYINFISKLVQQVQSIFQEEQVGPTTEIKKKVHIIDNDYYTRSKLRVDSEKSQIKEAQAIHADVSYLRKKFSHKIYTSAEQFIDGARVIHSPFVPRTNINFQFCEYTDSRAAKLKAIVSRSPTPNIGQLRAESMYRESQSSFDLSSHEASSLEGRPTPIKMDYQKEYLKKIQDGRQTPKGADGSVVHNAFIPRSDRSMPKLVTEENDDQRQRLSSPEYKSFVVSIEKPYQPPTSPNMGFLPRSPSPSKGMNKSRERNMRDGHSLPKRNLNSSYSANGDYACMGEGDEHLDGTASNQHKLSLPPLLNRPSSANSSIEDQ